MKLKHLIFKTIVTFCYRRIKSSETILKKIRERCEHPESENVNYMWRIGSITKADVCKVCGEVIRTPFSNPVDLTDWAEKNKEINEVKSNS